MTVRPRNDYPRDHANRGGPSSPNPPGYESMRSGAVPDDYADDDLERDEARAIARRILERDYVKPADEKPRAHRRHTTGTGPGNEDCEWRDYR